MSHLPIEPTRIGKIDYTNVWPVFHYFNESDLSRPAELVTRVPAILNRAMITGELDLSPVSSFAYASNWEQFRLLPGFSVSSEGAVNSILVFSREPLEQLKSGVISLTNTSATSVNLLKIIMEKAYGAKPTYRAAEPDLEAMMASSDAALLIGDHAIRASWEDHGYYVTDLGKVWKEWTGYGMTFAIWAVQATFADQNGSLLKEIMEAFSLSRAKSLQDLEPLIEKAAQDIGGTKDYWDFYFKHLCYDFTEERQRGLQLYFDYAYELGLLDRPACLSFWNDPIQTRVK